MRSVADIEVEPIGDGVSIREQVRCALAVLGESGLRVQVHVMGTEVEGDLEEIMAAVSRIHHALHDGGAVRITTHIKLETRTDRATGIAQSY